MDESKNDPPTIPDDAPSDIDMADPFSADFANVVEIPAAPIFERSPDREVSIEDVPARVHVSDPVLDDLGDFAPVVEGPAHILFPGRSGNDSGRSSDSSGSSSSINSSTRREMARISVNLNSKWDEQMANLPAKRKRKPKKFPDYVCPICYQSLGCPHSARLKREAASPVSDLPPVIDLPSLPPGMALPNLPVAVDESAIELPSEMDLHDMPSIVEEVLIDRPLASKKTSRKLSAISKKTTQSKKQRRRIPSWGFLKTKKRKTNPIKKHVSSADPITTVPVTTTTTATTTTTVAVTTTVPVTTTTTVPVTTTTTVTTTVAVTTTTAPVTTTVPITTVPVTTTAPVTTTVPPTTTIITHHFPTTTTFMTTVLSSTIVNTTTFTGAITSTGTATIARTNQPSSSYTSTFTNIVTTPSVAPRHRGKKALRLAQPTAGPGGQYYWEDVELKESGTGTGMGVFARRDIEPGLMIPMLGKYINAETIETLPSSDLTHVWRYNQMNGKAIDGHPSLNLLGLNIAMMINEDAVNAHNCIFKLNHVITVKFIPKGTELTVHYGPGYEEIRQNKGYTLQGNRHLDEDQKGIDLVESMIPISASIRRANILHWNQVIIDSHLRDADEVARTLADMAVEESDVKTDDSKAIENLLSLAQPDEVIPDVVVHDLDLDNLDLDNLDADEPADLGINSELISDDFNSIAPVVQYPMADVPMLMVPQKNIESMYDFKDASREDDDEIVGEYDEKEEKEGKSDEEKEEKEGKEGEENLRNFQLLLEESYGAIPELPTVSDDEREFYASYEEKEEKEGKEGGENLLALQSTLEEKYGRIPESPSILAVEQEFYFSEEDEKHFIDPENMVSGDAEDFSDDLIIHREENREVDEEIRRDILEALENGESQRQVIEDFKDFEDFEDFNDLEDGSHLSDLQHATSQENKDFIDDPVPDIFGREASPVSGDSMPAVVSVVNQMPDEVDPSEEYGNEPLFDIPEVQDNVVDGGEWGYGAGGVDMKAEVEDEVIDVVDDGEWGYGADDGNAADRAPGEISPIDISRIAAVPSDAEIVAFRTRNFGPALYNVVGGRGSIGNVGSGGSSASARGYGAYMSYTDSKTREFKTRYVSDREYEGRRRFSHNVYGRDPNIRRAQQWALNMRLLATGGGVRAHTVTIRRDSDGKDQPRDEIDFFRYFPYDANLIAQEVSREVLPIWRGRSSGEPMPGTSRLGFSIRLTAVTVPLIDGDIAHHITLLNGYHYSDTKFDEGHLATSMARPMARQMNQIMERAVQSGSGHQLQAIGSISVDIIWHWYDPRDMPLMFRNRGGCHAGRAHVRIFQSQDGIHTLRTISRGSTGNNCGLVCISAARRQMLVHPLFQKNEELLTSLSIHIASAKTSSQLRKKYGFLKSSMLSPRDLSSYTRDLGLNLIIYDGTFDVSGKPVEIFNDNVCSLNIEMVLFNQHYYHVSTLEDMSKNICHKCGNSFDTFHLCMQRCIDCGLILQENHQCISKLEPMTEAVQEAETPNRPVFKMEADPGFSLDWIRNSIYECLFDPSKGVDHILLHGPGGTGKSVLIKDIERKCEELSRSYMTVSSTGMAAIGVGGYTIHRAFSIINNQINWKNLRKNKLYPDLCQLEYLIIDEISMVSGPILDLIDLCLKKLKKMPQMPFGGVHLLMVGDMLQLKPVQAVPVLCSNIWYEMETTMAVFPLTKLFRFVDDRWGRLLSKIRVGIADDEVISTLRGRVFLSDQVKASSHLFIQNKEANIVNEKHLEQLPGDARTYEMIPAGEQSERYFKDSNPEITLKIGCRMMITSNHLHEYGLCNGSQGVVLRMLDDTIVCRFDDGKVINIPRVTFEDVGTKTRIKHFPVRLSAAITIHKSQGCSLDSAYINLSSGRIQAGQAYVALSRIRSLDGVYLYAFNAKYIKVDSFFLSFNNWCLNRDRVHFLSRAEKMNRFHQSSEVRLLPASEDRFNEYKLISAEIEEGQEDVLDTRDQMLVVCQKHKGRKKKYQAIIFDFETFFSKSAKKHVVYGARAKHVEFFIDYNVGDTKTTILSKYSRTWKVDGEDDVATHFFEWVMSRVKRREYQISNFKNNVPPISLCAYNGNKFDLFWFMNFFIQHPVYSKEYSTSICTRGSNALVKCTLISMHTGKNVLTSHDICDIIHMSLSDAVKNYGNGQSAGKGVFPHFYLSDDTYGQLASKQSVEVKLSHFPSASRKQVSEQNLNSFDLFKEYDQYFDGDIDSLISVYEGFNKICLKVSKAPVFEFSTMAQLTWYCFVANLDSRFLQVHSNGKKRRDRGIIKTKIFRLSKDDGDFVSQSIYGGCVLPRVLSYESKDASCSQYDEIKDYLIDADICSMYVYIMMNELYPYGEHYWANDKSLKKLNDIIRSGKGDDLPMSIMEIEFRFHPFELHPSVPHRDSKGCLLWANCAYDPILGSHDGGKLIRGVYTNIDICNIMESDGYIVPDVKRAMIWPKKGKVFKKWIEMTYQMKQEGTELRQKYEQELKVVDNNLRNGTSTVEECDKQKSNIRDKMSAANAYRQFGKTMGNACYGASTKRDHNNVYEFIHSYQDMTDFLSTHEWTDSMNFERFQLGLDTILVVQGSPIRSDSNNMCSRPRYLGAFTLSYTRRMILRLNKVINPFNRSGSDEALASQPFYGDTDSLLIHSSAYHRLKSYFGSKPGDLTDDINDNWNEGTQPNSDVPLFAKIVEGIFPCPKTYALKAILPDNSIKDIVKAKGIPDGSRTDIKIKYPGCVGEQKVMTYDMMKEILKMAKTQENFPGVTIESAGRISRTGLRLTNEQQKNNKQLYTITSQDLTRTLFKDRWNGRKASSISNITVPHGYNYHVAIN